MLHSVPSVEELHRQFVILTTLAVADSFFGVGVSVFL